MADQDVRKRKGVAGSAPSSSSPPSSATPPANMKADKKGPSPAPAKGSFCSCSTLFRLALMAILVILLGIGYIVIQLQSEIKELHPVAEMPFELDEAAKEKLFGTRVPVRFPKAFLPEVLLSPQDFLVAKADTLGEVELEGVQASKQPVFATVNPEAPLAEAEYLEVTSPGEQPVTMTAGDFWKAAKGGDHLLYEDMIYKSFLRVSGSLPPNIPMGRKGPLSPRFTFASRGIATKPTHYLANTFLTVLHGDLDVTFFAPSETHHLYPYPRNHLNGGSTQVLYRPKIESPAQVFDILTKHRNITHAQGSKTTLHAGDVVYIPPFWFYQMEFKTPAILLKTYSSIYESEVLDQLLRNAIPHIDHLDTLVAAVKRAVDQVITQGLGDQPSRFIRDLLHSRYLPLYKALEVSTSTDFTPCFHIDQADEGFIMEFMTEYIKQVTQAIKALESFGFVKELVTEEFLEHLVHKTLGAEDAYNFYVNCFDTGLSNSRSTAQDIE